MKRILFVNAIFQNNTPRSIRSRNFIQNLSETNEIHVLYFNIGNESPNMEGVRFHKIELKNKFVRWFLKSKTKNLIARACYKSINMSNYLKDPFYYDIENCSSLINSLHGKYGYKQIIVSVFPFSLYKLIELIPKSIVTFDIGDPLYMNSAIPQSKSSKFFNIEKKALEQCEKIIVTNSETKAHFIESYKLLKSKIKIVSQGYNHNLILSLKEKVKGDYFPKDQVIKIVYGGRFYKDVRNPSQIIESIKAFNKGSKGIKIELDIYGGKGVKIENGNGIKVHGSVSQRELFTKILRADYNMFMDFRFGIQSPGKIYECIALGKPLIFIRGDQDSLSSELIKMCSGVKFVDNSFEKFLELLSTLKKEDDSINSHFDYSDKSWKNLANKMIS